MTPEEILAHYQQSAEITREEMGRLARLEPGVAIRADVVSILGEPTWESKPSGRDDFVKATGPAFGKDWAEWYHDTWDGRRNWDRIMNYSTAGAVPGAPVEFLMVFLREGRYGSYLWQSGKAALSEKDLEQAKPLARHGTSREVLLDGFGPPAAASAEFLRYRFRAPPSLVEAGVSHVLLAWNAGTGAFGGMAPEFVWRHMDPAAMARATEKLLQAENRCRAAAEERREAGKRLTSGPEYDRVCRLLKRLFPALTERIGPVHVEIDTSKEVNAGASSGPAGVRVSVNRGLLDVMPDDGELAFVLAHELAHLVLRHPELPTLNVVAVLPDANAWQWRLNQEYEADVRGAEILARAGLDPLDGGRALKRIAPFEPEPPPGFIGDHPPNEMRRRLLEWYARFRGHVSADAAS
jgi:hypothetical protein